jgi:hypothetical protein
MTGTTGTQDTGQTTKAPSGSSRSKKQEELLFRDLYRVFQSDSFEKVLTGYELVPCSRMSAPPSSGGGVVDPAGGLNPGSMSPRSMQRWFVSVQQLLGTLAQSPSSLPAPAAASGSPNTPTATAAPSVTSPPGAPAEGVSDAAKKLLAMASGWTPAAFVANALPQQPASIPAATASPAIVHHQQTSSSSISLQSSPPSVPPSPVMSFDSLPASPSPLIPDDTKVSHRCTSSFVLWRDQSASHHLCCLCCCVEREW